MPDTEQAVDTGLRGVTMTVTERPDIGTQLLCAPNARVHGNPRSVFFGNTEPLPVEVTNNRGWPETLSVRGLDNHGTTTTQTVDVEYLSPVTPPEPVAHGANPDWPVEQCPVEFHRDEPHFHLTRTDGSDPNAWNMTAYQIGGYTTIEGRRFGKGTHVTVAVEPEPEWAPGYRYRVTHVAGGHGFPVGTIVTALDRSDSNIGNFHATIREVEAPFADLPQQVGTTAYVHGDNDYLGYSNVERVYGPAPVVRTRDDVQIGDTYRVTNESGGHGFTTDTIVTVASFNGSATQEGTSGYSILGTTTGVTENPSWLAGESAFLIVTGPDANCEYVPPVETPVETLVIAENGSLPEWPIRECTLGHPGVHYHVTIGGDAFDPTLRILYNSRIHEVDRYHTEQGVRYGGASDVAEWEAAHPPEPEPVPEPTIPPEEVLRRLVERENLDPDLHRRRTSIERIRSLLDEITTARTAVDTARHERAEWLDRLIERSRVVADEEDWCGVYDAGMAELGLPTRADATPDTETITVTATVEITVSFDDNDFDSWFENLHDESISSRSNSTYFTFTREVEAEVEVTEGECGCDEDIDWAEYLPDYVADNGYDWEIETRSCTND